MIIKKFVGKTEEEATQQAKDELGESIVIMNVKLIRKGGFFSFLSKPKTEVTVAKEEEDVMKSITNKKNSHPEEKIIEKEDFSSVKVSGPHISSIDIKVGEESDEEISRRKAEEEKEIRERRAKEKEKALKDVSLRAKEISGNSDAGKKLAQASKEGIIPPLKVGKAKMSESRQATMEIPDKDPYFNNLSINDIVNSEKNMVNADKDQAKIIEEKLDSLHHLLEKSMGESGKTTEKKEEKTFNTITESDNESVNEDDETKSFVKVLRNTLIENEVDEKNADELIKDVERIAKPDMPMEYLLANVYQKMVLRFGDSVKIVPAENTAKGLIFVGPTGVGKTTTIAKLASFFSVTQHKKSGTFDSRYIQSCSSRAA
jgi:flagellar biosynthesis protein FlhF